MVKCELCVAVAGRRGSAACQMQCGRCSRRQCCRGSGSVYGKRERRRKAIEPRAFAFIPRRSYRFLLTPTPPATPFASPAGTPQRMPSGAARRASPGAAASSARDSSRSVHEIGRPRKKVKAAQEGSAMWQCPPPVLPERRTGVGTCCRRVARARDVLVARQQARWRGSFSERPDSTGGSRQVQAWRALRPPARPLPAEGDARAVHGASCLSPVRESEVGEAGAGRGGVVQENGGEAACSRQEAGGARRQP